MATVSDGITDSLTRMGVLEAGETPSSADLALGYQTLNTLTDAWGTRRLTMAFILRTVATITANQASYTVGTGGNINIVRPVYITTIKFIDTSQSPTLEMPLTNYTDDQYAAIPQKTQTNTYPFGAYYNPTYAGGLGTLTPWPIPTKTTLQWAFYNAVAVPQFSATTSTLIIPSGYYRFIVTALAKEMVPMFQVPDAIVRRLDAAASEAERDIGVANFRISDLNTDAPVGGRGRYWGRSRFLSGP